MTGLFTRWKKSESSLASYIHTKPLVGNKHTLFDDIIGFEDVKQLFEMAIQAERPVHLYCVDLLRQLNRYLCVHLPDLKGLIMQ